MGVGRGGVGGGGSGGGVSGGMRGYRQWGRKVGAGVCVCIPVCVFEIFAHTRVCKSGITECISGPKSRLRSGPTVRQEQ